MNNINPYYYVMGIVVLIFVVIPLINRFTRIKNLKILDWVSVEYFPIWDSKIKLSTKSKFGIVVSSDGEVYKTQIETLIQNKNDTAFCNATLFISGIGWFVYRQQFLNIIGGRIPRKEQVILKQGEINEINMELEPKKGWKPITLKEKKYKCLLVIKLVDGNVKHKFTFQIRSQDIKAMHNRNKGQPNIIEVPIVRN